MGGKMRIGKQIADVQVINKQSSQFIHLNLLSFSSIRQKMQLSKPVRAFYVSLSGETDNN